MKTSPYELRGRELKIEKVSKLHKRKFFKKRRQQQKLEKNSEVLDVSEFLRKMAPKESRNKKANQYTETNLQQGSEEIYRNNMHF